MKVLSIDTSSANISFCIAEEKNIIYEFNRKQAKGASILSEYINSALRDVSMKLENFDFFVLGSGPGSFTGLRISFSIVKAFSSAIHIPVVCLESFFACAYPLRHDFEKIRVIADARRNMFYSASFISKKGFLQKKGRISLATLKDSLSDCRDYILVTYDAALRSRIKEYYPRLKFYPKEVYPRAAFLLDRAYVFFKEGKAVGPDRIKPLYLHPRTCQIRKKRYK